jgi:hypothetical protein
MLRRASGAPSGAQGSQVLQRIDSVGVAVSPSLCAYQFLFELQPPAE